MTTEFSKALDEPGFFNGCELCELRFEMSTRELTIRIHWWIKNDLEKITPYQGYNRTSGEHYLVTYKFWDIEELKADCSHVSNANEIDSITVSKHARIQFVDGTFIQFHHYGYDLVSVDTCSDFGNPLSG